MSEASVSLDRPWIPVAWAAGLGALMIWLASGPLEIAAGTRVEVEMLPISLVAPIGTSTDFPTHFEWAPVSGTSYYLVGAARVTATGTEPLFRQPGPNHEVDLQFDPGFEPPPGDYAWEVFAFGEDGTPIARGAGEFVVQ